MSETEKLLYAFGSDQTDGNSSLTHLLGGKGANLAEMSNLGIPVPPGFTISTEVCVDYLQTEEISEFLFNEEDEYEIILKNGKTKILLGSDGIFKKLDYLQAFESALPDDKNFNIYKYIDLRYKNQIIVRERI